MESLEEMVMRDIYRWANELNQDKGIKFITVQQMIDAYWKEMLPND